VYNFINREELQAPRGRKKKRSHSRPESCYSVMKHSNSSNSTK